METVFCQVINQEKPKWQLHSVPQADFYFSLHPYLKKWPVSSNTSKVAIGKFYIEIDRRFFDKGSRADNVYRYIDTFVKSHYPLDRLMSYCGSSNENEVAILMSEVTHCAGNVQKLNAEVVDLKASLQVSRKQLQSARVALRNVTNEKTLVQKQKELYHRKFKRSEKLQSQLEEELGDLQISHIDLSMEIKELEQETLDKNLVDYAGRKCGNDHFSVAKHGKKYSPEIRKLYYALLAQQIPTTKISDIIKSVLTCFDPSLDVEQIKLPHRSCAGYMRREELRTVADAHKVAVLCEDARLDIPFHLNSDGTTKHQKKIGAVAINNVVISVNEVSDGTAASAIDDVSMELEKLRNVARALGMPNSDCINWTLIASSTSDSASTQKRMNKLVEDQRKVDEQRFGPAKLEGFDLIECFCSMHLGSNLRKAFMKGTL